MVLSEHIRSNLQEHSLMEGMKGEELDFLLQIVEEKIYQKNEAVIRKDEISDELYLIHEGGVIFNQPIGNDPLHQQTYLLPAPGVFGESSFLKPRPQPFDVFAHEENTHLYILHRRELERSQLGVRLLNKLLLNLIRMDLEGSRSLPVVQNQELVLNQEQENASPVKEKQPVSLNQLKEEAITKWLPKNWNSRSKKEIEKLLDVKQFSAQDICIREEDPVESFYLLVEGQMNVLEWDDVKNQDVLVDVLNPGDHFGEASILEPMDSPYTIQAQQACTVLILDGKKIDDHIEEKAVEKLLDLLEDRDDDAFIWKNGEVVSSLVTTASKSQPNQLHSVNEKAKEEGGAKDQRNQNESVCQQEIESSPEHLDFLQQHTHQELNNQDEVVIAVKNQQLIQKKSFWLLSIVGLILSGLEPYKALGNLPALAISLFQIFTPCVCIYTVLKEPLDNWGWNKRFLGRSLMQAFVCIGVIGGVFEIVNQVADLGHFRFYSNHVWDKIMTFSLSSVTGYFIFVVIQEWLRRGVIALSLQRGLESKKGWGTALLSSLLFVGFSASYSPLFALALFAKDFVLTKFFLRSPHLAGIILIHFVLGLFFASLGWFTIEAL